MGIIKIDHIGIAVKSLDKGIALWKTAFNYKQKTEVVTNTRQKVKVVFLSKQDSIDIKLIEPIDDTSTIFAFTQKGGGFHHICIKCDDMESDLPKLKQAGLRIITPPQPGEAFENEDIAFLYAQGLNIELIETEKRARLLTTEED